MTGERSSASIDRLSTELRERGEPFVRVTVVRREPPVSAHVGDEAIVTADGEIHGWVGGANCARSVVTREAEAALATGEPKFVGLAPDPTEIERPGLEAFPMTCHSGGTIEVFLDPVVPARSIVIVGDTPVAHALADLVTTVSYEVVVVAGEDGGVQVDDAITTVTAVTPEAIREATPGVPSVVAASMGDYDVGAVVAGITLGADYLGLVASDRRAEAVAERAAERLDVDSAAVREVITTPAGVDIGAETPAEIALSVLAEVIAVHRGAEVADQIRAPGESEIGTTAPDVELDAEPESEPESESKFESEPESGVKTAVDPVCGMDVVPEEAAASVEFEGETYYFCSAGCADGFEREPTQYLPG